MSKRCGFILSLLVVVFVSVCCVARADNTKENKLPFTYEIKDKEVIITGYTGEDSVINIPSKIEGYDVTRIGEDVFANMSWITEVTLPEGIVQIDREAFSNCTGLTGIILPESLERIEMLVFAGCDGLTEIHIPKNVTRIKGGAFACNNIEKITVDKENEIFVADGNCLIDAVVEPTRGNLRITLVAVAKDFDIPEYIEGIASYTFYRNENITTIEFTDEMKYISVSAFEECDNLIAVVMPKNLQELSSNMFAGCDNLREVVFKEETLLQGSQTVSRVFWNCKNIEIMELPRGLTEIHDTMFSRCVNLELVKIQDGAERIRAFRGCRSLTKIEIPASVTSISTGVFDGCKDLIIYGVEGSAAHEYAVNNGIPFESVQEGEK